MSSPHAQAPIQGVCEVRMCPCARACMHACAQVKRAPSVSKHWEEAEVGKGGTPAKMQPAAQMSTAEVYMVLPNRSSGARYQRANTCGGAARNQPPAALRTHTLALVAGCASRKPTFVGHCSLAEHARGRRTATPNGPGAAPGWCSCGRGCQRCGPVQNQQASARLRRGCR